DVSTTDQFSFRVSREQGSARLGELATPHGVVETPAFMPVATQGTIKGLSMDEVSGAGGRMVLSNAYHLYLRPGDMMVRALGGLHAFARWDGPMLTDSGGFQVFSLAKLRTVHEDGVVFRSHLDGSMHEYSPEAVMRIERNIGADVIMQLDELIAGQAGEAAARAAMERSLRWLDRCRAEFDRIERDGRAPLGLTMTDAVLPDDLPSLLPADPERERAAPPQALFPIVQGGTHPGLRRASIAGILETGDWRGIAIGGLSVGESKPDMYAMLEVCDPLIPRALPRYLMGVGFPDDLVEGVRRGVDLFDCVAPTRMGRDGTAFTPDGKVQIRKGSHRTDRRPLVDGCGCPGCTRYDRAYLRHLFVAEEMLGLRLLALHNLTFLLDTMRDARAALRDGSFDSWSDAWLARYRGAAVAPA
ncbi:MAG TPA: tRNA guanosine(34) transglycosylase Tgt, partial [Gemmatimonadaceae bacterium]|nr:tRNA guanosine(34) transglycosylase Tgt [Gemmatimonadaceae bacterium]